MWGLVVDANIIEAYYIEIEGKGDYRVTDTTVDIFKRIGCKYVVCLDDQRQIETRWRNQVGYEWLEPWLAELYENNYAIPIRVDGLKKLRKRLDNLDFPKGEDFWYVRVAKASTNCHNKTYLLSEDRHFYDGKKKKVNNQTRVKILEKSLGAVAKELNHQGINVVAVCSWNKIIN